MLMLCTSRLFLFIRFEFMPLWSCDSGGGDELEDDFEIEPQFMPEAEEEELAMSKTERMKQARKNDKAWWVTF